MSAEDNIAPMEASATAEGASQETEMQCCHSAKRFNGLYSNIVLFQNPQSTKSCTLVSSTSWVMRLNVG
jgi:hypothetical protein